MTLTTERKRFISNIANDEWSYDLPTHESDAENDREFLKHEPKWRKLCEEFLTTSDSAEELHEFVVKHHWDDAADFLVLIENPACDRNTARLIFWLSGPEFYRRRFASREDVEYDHDRAWWDLIHRVTDNMANGKYSTAVMPEHFKDDIARQNESQESEPLWEINPLMYGED